MPKFKQILGTYDKNFAYNNQCNEQFQMPKVYIFDSLLPSFEKMHHNGACIVICGNACIYMLRFWHILLVSNLKTIDIPT